MLIKARWVTRMFKYNNHKVKEADISIKRGAGIHKDK